MLGFLVVGSIEQHQDRQGLLAPPDVVGLVLAGFLARSPNAEDIVANLESDSERFADLAEAAGGATRRAADDRSRPGGKSNDRGRFAADHRQVVVRSDIGPPLELKVQDLTADDLDRDPVELVDAGAAAFPG